MSYSRRQLEALGEPFGSCATRVKPGGHGFIYGLGNEPAPPAPETGPPSPVGIPDPFGYAGPAAAPPAGISGGPYSGGPAAVSVGIPDPFGYGPASVAPVITAAPVTTAAPTTTTGGGSAATTTGGGAATTTTGGGGAATTTGGGGAATTTGGGGAATTTGGGATTNFQQELNNLLREKLGTSPTQEQTNYWGGIFGLDNVITSDEVARLDAAIGNTGRTPGASNTANTILSEADARRAAAEAAARRAAEEAARQEAARQEAARRAAEEAARQQQQVNQGGQQTTTTSPGGFLGAPFAGGQAYNPFYAGPDARSDLVNMAYQRLLNRQPDTGGLASYSQEMMRGLTGQGLVSALARSPEFQRTQDFQRAYTSTFRPGYQEFGPSGQYNQPIYTGSYTNYARSPEFAQPLYNTTMMTPQQLGYGFGSFNPFAYGGTNPFADEGFNTFADQTTAPTGGTATGGGSTAAARGGRIKNDDGIAALLKR